MMLSTMRELIAAPFRGLAAIRVASAFGWDAWELPDDESPDSSLDERRPADTRRHDCLAAVCRVLKDLHEPPDDVELLDE
jgi:hypothetical protein